MSASNLVMFFVIGNIIGSGFFSVPAILAPIGLNLFYSWTITCSMAIIFALIFGRLYLAFPSASALSDYFISVPVRKLVAVFYWISCLIGNAGLLVILVQSLALPVSFIVLGLVVMLILTIINDRLQAETIAKIEIFLTISKFSILIGLPLLTILLKPTLFTLPAPAGSISKITSIGITSFWAFIGIESAAMFGSGSDAKRGLMKGVIACAILYVVTSLIVVGVVGQEAVGVQPFALLAEKFLGSQWKMVASIIVALTCLGALHGWVATTSKLTLVYAKSDLFPVTFLKKSPSGISFWGLWISSFATLLIFMLAGCMHVERQFSFIADLCVQLTLIIYAFCSYALFKKGAFSDKIMASLGILCVVLSTLFYLSSFLGLI